MKLPLLPSLALSLLAVACGGSPKPADTAAAKPEPVATAAAPASSTTTASADATAPKKGDDAKADAKKEPEKPYEPPKWPDFPGPKAAPVKGDVIWAVAPIQGSTWKSMCSIFRADETRIDGGDAVIKGVKGDVFVPGAFTKAPAKKDFKKGQAVLVAHQKGLYAGGSFGRVSDVVKADGKTTYKVKYVFASTVSEDEDVTSEEMIALDDKLGLGAPVAYKDGDNWKTAIYAAPAQDKKAYVLGWAGEMMQAASVKPLVVTKVFKKGDKVWAADFNTLEPVTITDVVDGGVQYKFKKDGEEKTVTFNSVTSPL